MRKYAQSYATKSMKDILKNKYYRSILHECY